MSEEHDGVSRRNFLRMVGAAGGTAAVHETMVALGLMEHPSAWAGPPECVPGSGKDKSVLVLGAGIGGLATTYWLSQCGYDCTILEADPDRAGGRNHTARCGSKLYEEGCDQPQVCMFDEGLYFNLGPGRIPYHHRRMLDLCDRLGVKLEVYVHTTAANFYQARSGFPDEALPRRRFAYDSQGYIAELLAKSIRQNYLDGELNELDRQSLLDLLRKFGDLDDNYKYIGSLRSGCNHTVDVKAPCNNNARDAVEKLELGKLLESRFWDSCQLGYPDINPNCTDSHSTGFYQGDEHLWQTTSFQPVDGMDQIVEGFKRHRLDWNSRRTLNDLIEYGARVTGIALTSNGKEQVEVTYQDKDGSERTKKADFCVSNIPMTVLKKLDISAFSKPFQDAIRYTTFSNACKVGWQANRRFWEEDDQIYGGISWAAHPITQMWYPSNDYFSKNGTLTGAFNQGDSAEEFGRLSPRERLNLAHEGGALLHPKAFASGEVPIDLGISVAWQKARFQEGCAAVWRGGDDERHFENLLCPDLNQRFFVVGDQVSSLPGWQEGAAMSAEFVFGQIDRQENLDSEQLREEITRAPRSSVLLG